VGDAELLGQPRMHLDARLGVLLHERSDPSGLRAREKLTDHASGREEDRVLVADIIHGQPVFADVETRFTIGEIERTVPFGDGVVAAALEQARRAFVVDGGPRARIVAVARPEDAELRVDFLVRDARIVRDAAFARAAQLLEDLAWPGERHAVGAS